MSSLHVVSDLCVFDDEKVRKKDVIFILMSDDEIDTGILSRGWFTFFKRMTTATMISYECARVRKAKKLADNDTTGFG